MDVLFVVLLSFFGFGIILSLCIKVYLSHSYNMDRAEFDRMIGKNVRSDQEQEPTEKEPLVGSA